MTEGPRWKRLILIPVLPVLAACSQILLARSGGTTEAQPASGGPYLILEALDRQCTRLVIDAEGRATRQVSCELDQSDLLTDDLLRKTQWRVVAARFAPFEFRSDSDLLVFVGEGEELATAAWQRALYAWAKTVRRELELGRGSASGALAMSWRRELPVGSGPARCAFLQVDEYGYAFASRANCEGGDPETIGHGWIADDLWATFDGWYQAYSVIDAEPELLFAGKGASPMSEDDRVALEVWAMTLYERLGTP